MTGAVVPYDAKRRREMITPEGLALTFVVASRGARFGAFLLDYVILLLGTIAFSVLLAYVAGGLGGVSQAENGEISGAGEFLAVLWTLAWFLAWNGYFMAFELGPRGGIPVADRSILALGDAGRCGSLACLTQPHRSRYGGRLPGPERAGNPSQKGGVCLWPK